MEHTPQDVADEFPGGQMADGGEIGAEQLFHAERFQHPVFGVGGNQLPGGVLWQGPGRLLEGEDCRDGALHPHGPGDDGPVADVHPVEYSQGHRRGISGISTPGNAIVFMASHAFRGQERVRARGGMFKRASRFSARRLPASPGPGTRRLGRTPGRGWSPAASDVPDPGRRRCRSGQPGRQ